jgi:hypothetical protein
MKRTSRRELRLAAGARHERTLEAVSSTPLFGRETPLCGRLLHDLPLLWLLLPQKRDDGFGHCLGLLQDEEVPRLRNVHDAHPVAHLVAERPAIARGSTTIIEPLDH